ncbi:unnamed protein product [Pleuronectes platessa]|uniref:Uncharacterized protein n=1 Tax=Pleuronectes platessa TaxID=8262 RepID=A0A9N7V4T9_PLEPL|nr:unnamed protein product [Pleuronectes platessa]
MEGSGPSHLQVAYIIQQETFNNELQEEKKNKALQEELETITPSYHEFYQSHEADVSRTEEESLSNVLLSPNTSSCLRRHENQEGFNQEENLTLSGAEERE